MRIVCEKRINGKTVRVIHGDLLEQDVDAIVNPANSLLIMGGGVAAAIKARGGSEVEVEARRYAPVPIGDAVVTRAGRLKARYVIHAPTMEKPAMRTNEGKVEQATKAALRRAVELGLSSIAFPGMGTGVGGLSYGKAASIMVKVINDFIGKNPGLKEIRLVALDLSLARSFCRELSREKPA